MALLWGNGRMLVGLLTYHQATGDAAALAGARRLAGFLLGVREATKAPEVMARVEGQGAFGFICFTQLAEGLVLLGPATGEARTSTAGARDRSAAAARAASSTRTATSRRCAARCMLHEATGDPALLAQVERLWGELVALERLHRRRQRPRVLRRGATRRTRRPCAPRRRPRASSRATRAAASPTSSASRSSFTASPARAELPRAGRALPRERLRPQPVRDRRLRLARLVRATGFMPTPSVDRAWWCCTMHGYRAYRDVLDSAVTARSRGPRGPPVRGRRLRRARAPGSTLRRTPSGFEAVVTGGFDGTLSVREPAWTDGLALRVNGEAAAAPAEHGYRRLRRAFRAGDRVEGAFTHRLRLVRPDRSGDAGRAARDRARPRRPLLRPVPRGSGRCARSALLQRALAGKRHRRCLAASRPRPGPPGSCGSACRTSTKAIAGARPPCCGRWARSRLTTRARSRSGSTTGAGEPERRIRRAEPRPVPARIEDVWEQRSSQSRPGPGPPAPGSGIAWPPFATPTPGSGRRPRLSTPTWDPRRGGGGTSPTPARPARLIDELAEAVETVPDGPAERKAWQARFASGCRTSAPPGWGGPPATDGSSSPMPSTPPPSPSPARRAPPTRTCPSRASGRPCATCSSATACRCCSTCRWRSVPACSPTACCTR